MRLASKTRVYNKNLHDAIVKSGLTNKEIGKAIGLTWTTVSMIRNCKHWPNLEQQAKLCKLLNVNFDDIFPPEAEEVYARVAHNYKQNNHIREIEITSEMLESEQVLTLDKAYEEVEQSVSNYSWKKTLDKALTPREAELIKCRFGLDDGVRKTYEEVGHKFNVTRERVRQIEAKCLEKLRMCPDMKQWSHSAGV